VVLHLSMWMVATMASLCRNEAKLKCLAVNVMGIWDHLVWEMGSSMTT
jgi:hypothetical protein